MDLNNISSSLGHSLLDNLLSSPQLKITSNSSSSPDHEAPAPEFLTVFLINYENDMDLLRNYLYDVVSPTSSNMMSHQQYYFK